LILFGYLDFLLNVLMSIVVIAPTPDHRRDRNRESPHHASANVRE
jgi:hypothetical protein